MLGEYNPVGSRFTTPRIRLCVRVRYRWGEAGPALRRSWRETVAAKWSWMKGGFTRFRRALRRPFKNTLLGGRPLGADRYGAVKSARNCVSPGAQSWSLCIPRGLA